MSRMQAGVLLGGRYRLHRELGKGGTGQVWAGRDERLGRPVAVKTAAPEPDEDAEAQRRSLHRFEREARAAAALDHANLTAVYDADVHADVRWIAMQLVDGETVDVILGEQEGERLDVTAAAAVTAQVCAGLSTAHAADLVHRDLKPENVMVRSDGVVKILDFGLVKLTTESAPQLTMTGEHLGNLLYASPELLSGAHELDGRSDLYAVGCLLYRMLAGVPPFPTQQSVLLASAHLRHSPPALADHGLEVPTDLQELISALLAKEPPQRPGTAAEVYATLSPHLPPSDPSRAADRRRALLPEDPCRPFVLPQGPHPVT